MNTFLIKDVIKKGWSLTKIHFWLFVRLLVVTWGISFVSDFVAAANKNAFYPDSLIFTFTALALGLLSFIVHIGFLKMSLLVHDGKNPDMSDLLSYYPYFWKFLLVSISLAGLIFIPVLIVGLVVIFLIAFLHSMYYMLLLILLIIPIAYILPTYGFVQLLVLDKNMGVRQAFRTSKKITEGNKLHIIGLGLVLLAINILGGICLFVGLFFSIPITTLAFIATYKTLMAEEEIEAPIKTIALD